MRAGRIDAVGSRLSYFRQTCDFEAFIALHKGCLDFIAWGGKGNGDFPIDKTAPLVVDVGDGAVDGVAKFHERMKTQNGHLEKRRPFEAEKKEGMTCRGRRSAAAHAWLTGQALMMLQPQSLNREFVDLATEHVGAVCLVLRFGDDAVLGIVYPALPVHESLGLGHVVPDILRASAFVAVGAVATFARFTDTDADHRLPPFFYLGRKHRSMFPGLQFMKRNAFCQSDKTLSQEM